MRVRTSLTDLIAVAASTPHSEPVGLTAQEIKAFEDALSMKLSGDLTLCGRRVVRIPWDWCRDLDATGQR